MATVKVWNDNVHPFSQEMKGDKFTIQPGGFIEMEYEEAVYFRGLFSPMPPSDYAGDERLFYKMIRVEDPPPNSIYKDDDALVNHYTGKRAESAGALAEALAPYRHLLVVDKSADNAASTELADLKAQVALLTQAMSKLTEPKRGPGRPPNAKEA